MIGVAESQTRLGEVGSSGNRTSAFENGWNDAVPFGRTYIETAPERIIWVYSAVTPAARTGTAHFAISLSTNDCRYSGVRRSGAAMSVPRSLRRPCTDTLVT